MTFLIFSISTFVFITLIVVFYNAAKRSDEKRRRLDIISAKRREEFFDDDLEKPFFQRFLLPIFKVMVKRLSEAMSKPANKEKDRNKLKNKDNKKGMERNLRLAGINLTVNEVNAVKLILTCGFVLLALIVDAFIRIDFALEALIVIVSLIASLIIPTYYIKYRITSRQEGIRNQLPDVMDLLSVSIEAGLGFDSALIKIGERLSGPLVEELNIVLIEIQLGKPRRDALRGLSERSDIEELRTFVSSVVQAEQLGIPMKNVLLTQAKQLRVIRRQKAEEKAMKAPIKMMLPLVGFVFPVLFIILLGPTVLQIIDQLGG